MIIKYFQSGAFKSEVVPVTIKQKKGPDVIVSEDEEFKKVSFDKLPQLKPVFVKEGGVERLSFLLSSLQV